MTAWKERALAAEQKLADSKRELEAFYAPHGNSEYAIAALHRLCALLGVSRGKSAGVPETMTRQVEYVRLGGKS
jgi:hypothetical protein